MNENDMDWLREKARLTTEGAIVSEFPETLIELAALLDDFCIRQKQKLEAMILSQRN